MKIFFFDELRNDPRAFARQLYEYIGVDPAFESPTILTRVNAAHQPRVSSCPGPPTASAAFYALGSRECRRRGQTTSPDGIVVYRPRDLQAKVDPAVAAALRQSLVEDMQALQRLLDRPLPSGWLHVQEHQHS